MTSTGVEGKGVVEFRCWDINWWGRTGWRSCGSESGGEDGGWEWGVGEAEGAVVLGRRYDGN